MDGARGGRREERERDKMQQRWGIAERLNIVILVIRCVNINISYHTI